MERKICSPSDHPELYLSPLLSEAHHLLYQQLVGMLEWSVQMGRFDICYALTSLKRLPAAPREGHISQLVKIFGYLQIFPGRRKGIFVSPEDIEDISGKGDNVKYWLEKYPGASKEIDEGLSEPSGSPLRTSVYFDSDYAHDQVTR